MNVGDLGHSREHCLQLLKRLRGFRGVWAGVRVLQGGGQPAHTPFPRTGKYSSEY